MIFDLDGVICRTDQLHFQAWKAVANRLGSPFGSSSRNTALILQQLGLDGFFEAVADGTQIRRSKPDPEVFLLAASLLGVQPARALVVEDAKAGILAAKAGGFLAAGLGDAIQAPGVDFPLSSLEELCSICSG